ncbi:MAG: hypothetical protein WKF70_04885 [Chitinophagaceae bacterium]
MLSNPESISFKPAPGKFNFQIEAFSSLYEALEEGLFIVDTNFTIIYLNQKAVANSKEAHGITYKVGDHIVYSLPHDRH